MKPSLIMTIALVSIALILVSAISMSKEGFFGGSPSSGGAYGVTNDRGTFTMYYADWCPHCQNVKPLFKEFMGSGIVEVNGIPVKVAMKEEKEIKKGTDPDVAGYPSFLYTDAAGKVVEFKGPRNADGFMEFLKQQILS
jgi:thiol-disulfide isomerase/thioredoxin